MHAIQVLLPIYGLIEEWEEEPPCNLLLWLKAKL